LADQAEQAIAHYGIEVATARISQRAAFYHSLTAGEPPLEFEPAGAAAVEIEVLYELTCKHIKHVRMNTRNKATHRKHRND